MPDILILGGGLTGLAAALEVQRLGLPYTLIEVKPRLGGSIVSEERAGFLFDGGPFLHERYGEWPWLDGLGLRDAVRAFAPYRDGELVYFAHGTAQVIDAMTVRLTGTLITRMAVSSVGPVEGRLGVCLENGVLRMADAVIAALPARYAAHLLYDLAPDAALLLDDYQYDAMARVSLGYRLADVPNALPEAPGPQVRFLHRFTLPERVPPDHVMIRAGVRVEAGQTEADWIAAVRGVVGPAEPVAAWSRFWPEADPLTGRLPEFADTLDALCRALPPTVAICNSDYGAFRLDQRIAAGTAAAQQIAAALS